MKKWLAYLHIFTCVLVVASVVLFSVNFVSSQNRAKKEKAKQDQIKIDEKNTIEYKANQTIRVKYSKTGKVVAMDINDYLRGVVPSEMPPSYNIEALKAQALVARTYTYQKMSTFAEGADADICDSFGHCQAFYDKETLFRIWKGRGYDDNTINEYWDRVNEAVVSTQNEVIMYDNKLIKAFFHASSPVKTENVDQIWGGEQLPYLVSVESKEAEDYPNRTSSTELNFNDIVSKLKENKLSSTLVSDDVKGICINEYTTSGRVRNIKIKDCVVSAEKLRTMFGLKSTNFTIDVKDNSVCFNVIGYGHGVGLSQVGANYYANNENMNYQDIIKHYFTDVNIVKLD